MKRHFILFLFIASCLQLNGQKVNTNLTLKIDSLKQELVKPITDSLRAGVLGSIARTYMRINPDSSIVYCEKAIKFYEKTNNFRSKNFATGHLMEAYINLGNLPKALDIGLNTIRLIEESGIHKSGVSPIYDNLGFIYYYLGDYEKALQYYGKQLFRGDVDMIGVAFAYFGKAVVYETINELDSALINLDKSRDAFSKFSHSKNLDDINTYRQLEFIDVYPAWYNVRSNVYIKQNKKELALEDLRTTLKISLDSKEDFHTANTYIDIAAFYKTLNQSDSSIYYATKGIEIANEISHISAILDGSQILAELYEFLDPQKALQYFKLAANTEKQLYGAGNIQVLKDMISKDEKRKQDLQIAESAFRTKLRQNILFGSLATLLLVALILFRNNRNKKKANDRLTKQKKEIEDTLGQLKATQSQLIQSEKMASLGELTAGIAHEIQNPLNFVNNFSEVSSELVDELQEELNMNNSDVVREISNDIKQNLDKINHHGQRASGIVKGMLEHSRTSDGKKELTDINALADEYLRLAYHGLRAKDNSFNADFKTDFDESLPKLNVVPQDISRVLLNLINNAFYAVDKRSKENHKDYKPEVVVSTKSVAGQIEISVKDNGPGIPAEIKGKIFQPFFTTKPTGSGTGLGLSLSYDIIKAYGGELKVETKEGEGSEFIIHLPIV